MSESRLIVGLGNPGTKYEFTRHNLGFLVVRRLSERLNLRFKPSSLTNGLSSAGKAGPVNVVLLMPLTYMNHSGRAVKQVVSKKEFSLKDILVVCDDLNLNFGEIRIRAKGSDGGNNGLRSVIYHLETERFSRLRLGIGQPAKKEDAVSYVLEEFKKNEKERLENFIDEAADCCLVWLQEGITKAMERYNKRKNDGKE